jgi:hypothetical protein
VRRVLVVAATTAAVTALLSCSGPPPSAGDAPTTSRMVYEPSARVSRAPLPPPVSYASPSRNSPPAAADTGVWRASPRSATVKGKGCVVVEQDSQGRSEVENCSKEDIDAGNEVRVPHSNVPGSSPGSHEPDWPSGSEEPSPTGPVRPAPPSQHQSSGMIEPWTGAI